MTRTASTYLWILLLALIPGVWLLFDFARQPPPAAQIAATTAAGVSTTTGLTGAQDREGHTARFGWEGWVVTTENQPFAAAIVHIEMNLGSLPITLQTTADADGYFFIDGTPFQRHPDFDIGSNHFRIMLEGYSSRCPQQWRPPTSPPQQLSIQATGTRRLQVRATWLPDRTPVQEAPIHAFLTKESGFAVASTDEHGTAIFHLPAETEWEFMCYGNGLGFGRSESFESSDNNQDVSFDLHPYPKQVQVVAIDEATQAPLTTARFVSRHYDDDVLVYHENLAAMPADLPAELGVLNLKLPAQSPVYLLIEAEGYQPAAVGIFATTAEPLKIALAPLKPRPIQVVEQGQPMPAKLRYEVHARQHRFGTFSHTTSRPADVFELSTDESGCAMLMLPDEVKYYGYNLLITAADRRTHLLTKLQAKNHPNGTWVIEFAESVDLSAVKPGK